MSVMPAEPLLSVRDLHVELRGGRAPVEVIRGVDLQVGAGEIVGLVGESGSGKTLTALSILHLLPPALRVTSGAIRFDGLDLLRLSSRELQALRGGRIAMIFQDPMRHLNPVFTIGEQLEAVIRAHEQKLSARAVRDRAIALLGQVQIVDPERRLRSYPHQFSGGMAQRVMIAMALAGSPALLLADEPTAALDVTVQAEILRLVRQIARERGMAVVFISHNIGAVWQLCDRVCVMYAGQMVEVADTATLIHEPAHPYSRALLAALPQVTTDRPRLASIPGGAPVVGQFPVGCAFHPRCAHIRPQCATVAPAVVSIVERHQARCLFAGRLPTLESGLMGRDILLAGPPPEPASPAAPMVEVRGLTKRYRTGSSFGAGHEVTAVKSVSLAIMPGESFGLVGESGSGKTTLGRLLLRLEEPTEGTILFEGNDITHLPEAQLRRLRPRMQMVFQDPFTSLNPWMSIGQAIAEPLRIHRGLRGPALEREIARLLDLVGLPAAYANRRPRQFSGGQRQRIGLARALALEPHLLVLDEPTSALDVSVQAQILNLLRDLQQALQLTYIFISHDLAVVGHLCDRVGVMRHGELLEIAPRDVFVTRPQHAYSQALRDAVPEIGRPLLEGGAA
jgi:oligopeptide/dipeptide ABC transporter ATP-binding protein